MNNYEKAVEHDTDETTAVYKKAFKRMLDRLGCEKNDGGEGYWSVQLPVSFANIYYSYLFAIWILYSATHIYNTSLTTHIKLHSQHL